MASYKSFEDLPVWQKATDLAAEIFKLTANDEFKFRGDLVNQIRRASLSVSNNIAEGFERGSTPDLINFLYIARGSCGETRSMLRFAPKLGGMESQREAIELAAEHCESVSRQLYGWIEALKNSGIEGQRHLDDKARVDYAKAGLIEEFREKFSPAEMNRAAEEGRLSEMYEAQVEALIKIKEAGKLSAAKEDAPECPQCGGKMVKRHDRNGRAFWGCAEYPRCRGTRPYVAKRRTSLPAGLEPGQGD